MKGDDERTWRELKRRAMLHPPGDIIRVLWATLEDLRQAVARQAKRIEEMDR